MQLWYSASQTASCATLLHVRSLPKAKCSYYWKLRHLCYWLNQIKLVETYTTYHIWHTGLADQYIMNLNHSRTITFLLYTCGTWFEIEKSLCFGKIKLSIFVFKECGTGVTLILRIKIYCIHLSHIVFLFFFPVCQNYTTLHSNYCIVCVYILL